MNELRIFELYKPIRNLIRKLSIGDSLQFIWAIWNNIQNNKPIPADIEMRREYYGSTNATERKIWSVAEWELEFLMSEVMLHANTVSTDGHSLKKLQHLAKGCQSSRVCTRPAQVRLWHPALIQSARTLQ